jgi:hypothetical protein
MGVHLNIDNKITVNTAFKTTISVAVGASSIFGTVVFYHRHELVLAAISLVVSAVAWLRAATRMPLVLMLFAWCGGTAEYEEPTPHGVRRVKLSNLPDSRLGVEIVLGLAAAVLVAGAVHVSAATVAGSPSRAAPAASPASRAEYGSSPDQAVVRAFYGAINKRDWPNVWRLGGNSAAGVDSIAYKEMMSGFRCTVHDQITRITSNRGITLVRIKAQESNGAVNTVQNYRFSYVVEDGLIRKGTPLGQTGNPPPGCGEKRT